MENTLSAVVLAGGAGARLASVTGGVPKQFWRPDGGPTLLEQTLTRIEPLVPRKRCLVVVDEAHRELLDRCALGAAEVLSQPENRGTAAAVIYALLRLTAVDPRATVLLTPTDHGVANPRAFLSTLRKGITHAASSEDVVLFGVEPSVAYTDHGWIAVAPGQIPGGAERVAGFVEKPSLAVADRLLRLGALVNTMIIAARAEALVRLCTEHLPALTASLADAVLMSPGLRDTAVRQRFAALPAHDFSRDVLTRAAGLRTYRIPAEAAWSDLGTPERAADWMARAPESRQPIAAH